MSGKSEKCSWCHGAGVFSDFDSDLSYGMPVCPGCGGLGVVFKSERFEALRKDIFRLRFEYCPIGEEISEEEQAKKRNELIEAIRKIYEEFGNKKVKSFAGEILRERRKEQ